MAQLNLDIPELLPRTPKEALARGIDRYFTGKQCPKGHVTWRYVNKKKGGGGPCNLCVCPSSPDSWAAQNKEKRREAVNRYARSERNLVRSAKHREDNREHLRKYHAAWRRGEVGNKGGNAYRDSKRIYFNEWRNNKLTNDPRYKAVKSLRDRLYSAMKNRDKRKTASLIKLVGCTKEQLVSHIETQFEDGMSWDNYSWKTWHIDHIKPIATFKDPQDPACWHYTNLRPRWAQENIAAGARLRWDLEQQKKGQAAA